MKHPSRPLMMIFIVVCLTLNTCSNNARLIKKLPAEYHDIYQKLQYLITAREKSIFLNLKNDNERRHFLDEFWERRDPDPETPENEFMITFFDRISKADRLFRDEGSNGWRSDRGRVYILLGPPDFREIYPTGYSMFDLPSEVWYYGNFPVVFIDRNRSGSYDLTSLGAKHFSQLLKVSQMLKPELQKQRNLYSFSTRTERGPDGRMKLVLRFDNRNILFIKNEDQYYSDMTITMDFRMRETEETFSLSGKKRIRIPDPGSKRKYRYSDIDFLLDLRKGTYDLDILLENEENGIKVQRSRILKIKQEVKHERSVH